MFCYNRPWFEVLKKTCYVAEAQKGGLSDDALKYCDNFRGDTVSVQSHKVWIFYDRSSWEVAKTVFFCFLCHYKNSWLFCPLDGAMRLLGELAGEKVEKKNHSIYSISQYLGYRMT